jgi:hypothetical protein
VKNYEGYLQDEDQRPAYFKKGWMDKLAFAQEASRECEHGVPLNDVRHEFARWVWETVEGERTQVLRRAIIGKQGSFPVTIWESWVSTENAGLDGRRTKENENGK